MTTTPTPEEFLALNEPEDDTDDEPVIADPLASIAESLRAIAAGYTGFLDAWPAETAAQERYDRLDQEYADLEDKHRALYELLADVEKIVKPSTSKLANSIREAINRWRNPAVPADIDPEEPAGEGPTPGEPLVLPAHDADVEEWRGYARQVHVVPDEVTVLDQMNRSQIRTLLGIKQPVENPA